MRFILHKAANESKQITLWNPVGMMDNTDEH